MTLNVNCVNIVNQSSLQERDPIRNKATGKLPVANKNNKMLRHQDEIISETHSIL